jgi:PAS domain S-box-containing protein
VSPGRAGVKSGWWSPRRLAWLGALFIAALAAQAAYGIWRGYHDTLRDAERDTATQARVIAEQTARGIQAVDVVLKHVAEQLRRGALSIDDPEALHRYLHEQAQGLVQTNGLVVFGADRAVRALSRAPPDAQQRRLLANEDPFGALRDRRVPGLLIDNVQMSVTSGLRMFPIARRAEDRDGRFIGVVGAPGRVEYFQAFYRDTYSEADTRIALVHQEGWLLARHPPADAALGTRLAVVDRLLPPGSDKVATVTRLPSPVDGVDHIVAMRRVPDYPLIVAVSRDAAAAFAPWRRQALGTALRTLALGALAAGLLWATLRQLSLAQGARRAAEQSEERYALAMTGSDEGHWLWDIPARQVYVSARLAQLFGFGEGAVLMADEAYFSAIPLHPDDRERVHRSRNDHVAGLSERLDHEFRTVVAGSGEVRWIHTRAQCFRDADGRPLRLAGSTVDVTPRKRAEEALRRSEEHYALAMAGSRGGHWVYESRSDAVYVSPALNEMLGLPTSTAALSRADWVAQVPMHPDDVPQVMHVIGAQIEGRLAKADYECRIVLPEGVRWTLTRTRRFADADGQGLRIAGVTTDITERKLAEVERQRLEDQLRQAQKLEAIGTLAGGIAHDFNNILSAILGYGELAQNLAAPGTPLRRHVDASIAAGQRAKSLVERILAFSRSGMGERVPVHVQSVVEEALDGVAATLPAGVRLQRRLAVGDAGVLGDATQIHQVVMNLCANAVQAVRDEGRIEVSLDICRLDAPLAVATSTLPPGEYLRLAIADSGCGIEPALLERIFDPFFTTKEVGVGTGLGLSLVHGIVTDLGGGIAVQSRVDEGSRFTAYLPLRAHVAPRRLPASPVIERGQGQTVLVVDDEEALVRLGEEALAELGYEPVGHVLSSGALAALRAEPQRFDLLLTDEAMPGLTGSELARAARLLRPDLPVVLMSGFVTPALRQRALDIGVAEVLNKPLAAADIARALARALGGLRAAAK